MPRIPGSTVAWVAFRAGFRNSARSPQLTIAVAIAAGESGWNTTAHNPIYPDDSYGLWQINRLAHAWARPPGIYDAQTNAHAAFRVYRQSGYSFRPWTVYTRGIYERHMNSAWSAVNAMGQGGPVGGGGGPGFPAPAPTDDTAWNIWSPLTYTGNQLDFTSKWVLSHRGWLRRITGRP